MASTTRIPKAELTGIYGAMVRRMSRKMLGDVAEPVEVAVAQPEGAELQLQPRSQGTEVGPV